MLYLLWGIINIALFLFFIVLCFKATRLVRERIGMLAALVFAIGLLSFMASTGNNDNKAHGTNTIKKWNFTPEDSVEVNFTRHIIVDLDNNPFSTNTLGIRYGKSKNQNSNTPIDAYSVTEGLVSGTSWRPMSINVDTITGNRLKYQVVGVVEWKLLALTIYSQRKNYEGAVAIDKANY